eukprot:scaffold10460_cov136-Skeletonema_marinoi.AAC.1
MEESDSSHSSSSSEEEREEEEESYTYYNTFEDPRSPLAAADSPTGSQIEQDSDDEPSPWLRSKAKQRVIKELKDEKSSIHSMKVQDIHQTFAPRYLLARFKQNYKRLLDNLKARTGPFAELQQNGQDVPEEPEVEKWWTSGSISKGYSLLYNLYMEPEGTGIEGMSVRTLWKSHAVFRCYDFELFEEYNKKMIKLTKKHKKLVEQDEADFQHDMKLIPETSELAWYKHPAKDLLKKDVKDGVASSTKPKELRQTREEYQEFPIKKFCKEVYHEKQKQCAKPFWQWFRNKQARQIHESEVNKMRRDWIHDEDVNQLTAKLDSIYREGTS